MLNVNTNVITITDEELAELEVTSYEDLEKELLGVLLC